MSSELRTQAAKRIRRRRNFETHVIAQLAATVFLTLVWAVTEYQNSGGWPTGFRTGRMNHDWDPWIIYPVLAGAFAVGLHAWIAFGRRPATDAEIAREVARIEGQS
ncbi:MAG TPA: 2TM domain-containing protein [Gaiellaceae bacterium]